MKPIPALVCLFLLTGGALRATDVLSLDNRSKADWTLKLLDNPKGDPFMGSIEVEYRGKVVKTLSQPGQTWVLPSGYKCLLLFSRGGFNQTFSMSFGLLDDQQKTQRFRATPEAFYNGAIKVRAVAPHAAADLYPAGVFEYEPDQYDLAILGDRMP